MIEWRYASRGHAHKNPSVSDSISDLGLGGIKLDKSLISRELRCLDHPHELLLNGCSLRRSLTCVACSVLDADFFQLRLHRAIEFVIRSGQCVGQLLDTAGAQDDRGDGGLARIQVRSA
jgi:hypothetical protein